MSATTSDPGRGIPDDGPSEFISFFGYGVEERLTDAAVEVLRRVGGHRLTLAAVAEWQQVSRQAIQQQAGTRARFLEMVTTCFGDRWRAWASRGYAGVERLVRLPATADALHGTRVWRGLEELAWGELLAGNDAPARAIAEHRGAEDDRRAWLVARDLDRDLTEVERDLLAVVVDGLLWRMTLAVDPLPLDRATAVLRAHLESLGWDDSLLA